MLRTRYKLIALAGAAAIALTGCTAATSGSTTASVAPTGAAATACVATAQAAVDAASAPLELVKPTAPLDLTKLSGKTVWFVTLTMNQFSQDMSAGMSAAATAAGATPVLWDSQGTVNKLNEGLEQAVAQGAGGIVLVAADPTLVSASMVDVQKAGIPTLDFMSHGSQTPVPTGFFNSFSSDFSADGKLAADWALAKSGYTADMTVIDAPVLQIWVDETTAATDEFTALCPDCTINTIHADLANLATDLPSQLQTQLQKDPSTDYVFAAWDSAVPLLTPVIAASGLTPTVMGRDGIAASLKMISSKSGQDFTLAMPPAGWIGWAAFDEMARKMTGVTVPDDKVPTRIIDASNIGDGTDASVSPNYVDYQQQFIDAWKG